MPIPDNFLRVCVQMIAAKWRNKDYESLLERALRISDQKERLALYQQADRLLMEESLIVPLVYSQQHMMLKPWVRKFPTTAIKNPGFLKDCDYRTPLDQLIFSGRIPASMIYSRRSRPQAGAILPPAGESHLTRPPTWEASDQEVIEAAKAAHLHEFIETLPEKYDTVIGESGARLSGGQAQRLDLARADF